MYSDESKVNSKLILANDLNFNEKKLKLTDLFVQEVLNFNKNYNLIDIVEKPKTSKTIKT